METRDLSAAELLGVWERGAEDGPVERAIMLLASVHDVPYTDVLRWPVGVRDARLLAFRARLWGPVLEVVTDCPSCGETAEADLPFGELLASQEDVPERQEVAIGTGDVVVGFRPATSEDVLGAMTAGGERALLERVVETPAVLDEQGIEALLLRALADADPLADLQLDIGCPACGRRWTALLDPPSFVWSEIDAWALRLLREVHLLAVAYGWSERDILALAPARRAAYLAMLA